MTTKSRSMFMNFEKFITNRITYSSDITNEVNIILSNLYIEQIILEIRNKTETGQYFVKFIVDKYLDNHTDDIITDTDTPIILSIVAFDVNYLDKNIISIENLYNFITALIDKFTKNEPTEINKIVMIILETYADMIKNNHMISIFAEIQDMANLCKINRLSMVYEPMQYMKLITNIIPEYEDILNTVSINISNSISEDSFDSADEEQEVYIYDKLYNMEF